MIESDNTNLEHLVFVAFWDRRVYSLSTPSRVT